MLSEVLLVGDGPSELRQRIEALGRRVVRASLAGAANAVAAKNGEIALVDLGEDPVGVLRFVREARPRGEAPPPYFIAFARRGSAAWREALSLGVDRVLEAPPDFGELAASLDAAGSLLGSLLEARELSHYVALSGGVLCALDERGRIYSAPSGWSEVLELDEEELFGTPFLDLIHEEDRPAAAGIVAAGADIRDLQIRVREGSGSYRWISWMASSSGTARHAVGRDVARLVETDGKLHKVVAQLYTKKREVEEQKRVVDRLRAEAEFQATHDALTGLLNRRAWFDLAAEVDPVAVVIFDIDHFKRVNDTYGHPEGDRVLSEVADRLSAAFRDEATLARLGGEEFGAYLYGTTAEAATLAEEAVARVAASPIRLSGGAELAVTISAGFAAWQIESGTPPQILADTYDRADQALYEAKESGRARLVREEARRAA